MFGAMSKRGQDTTSSDSSPVGNARPSNLVMHSQCKEDVSPQSSGSRANSENDDERKKQLAWPQETGDIPTQTLKVGIPKVNRKEMVNLTHRKLRRKDQTRANSEQDSSSTRKIDSLSPEMEKLRFSNHRYMGKICQCLQKKLGRSALDATFSIESYKHMY